MKLTREVDQTTTVFTITSRIRDEGQQLQIIYFTISQIQNSYNINNLKLKWMALS